MGRSDYCRHAHYCFLSSGRTNTAGRSVIIKFISCSSTLLAGVLDRLAEYYGSSAPKAYRALRIDAPDSTPIAEQLDHSDQRLGFSLVGTLPNELDSGDVKLLVAGSHIINPLISPAGS